MTNSTTPALPTVRWLLEYTFDGDEVGSAIYESEDACRASAETDGGVCVPLVRGPDALQATADLTRQLDELRRWRSTHAPRLEAIEGLYRTAQKEAHGAQEAVASLASEREANAMLTARVEELEHSLAAMTTARDIAVELGATYAAQLDEARAEVSGMVSVVEKAVAGIAEMDGLLTEARAEVERLREFFDADQAVSSVFDEVSPGLSCVPDGHADRLAQAIDRRAKAVTAIDATKGAPHAG